MSAPRTHEKQGSVECPYCGHQIVSQVAYRGQMMHCQNCTSAVLAPVYTGGTDKDDMGIGCVFFFLLLFAIGFAIAIFAFGYNPLDIMLSYWTWGLFILGVILSAWFGYSSDE